MDYQHIPQTGIEIPFPVIEDRDMAIARMYGMIQPGVSGTETVRNVFYIDPNGIIRAKLIYPMTNGRNIGELLRLLDFANVGSRQGCDTGELAARLSDRDTAAENGGGCNEAVDSGENCMDRYLCYNQPKELI